MHGYTNYADAAFDLIVEHREGRTRLSEKGGSFTGQLVAGMSNLTDRQRDWLDSLLSKAGLPALDQREAA